jgi:hypothetical protein
MRQTSSYPVCSRFPKIPSLFPIRHSPSNSLTGTQGSARAGAVVQDIWSCVLGGEENAGTRHDVAVISW